ncbi:MAG: PIG-L deacetylase family protein, partial [Candidatus Zipacnadales bacterium]
SSPPFLKGEPVVAERRCVVAVAAHAADMEFSAGATLLKHVRLGWEAHIIQLTLGEKGDARLSPCKYGVQKREEAKAACKLLGVKPHFLPFADGELTVTEEVARPLAVLFRRLQPNVIITHWRNSIHADHIAAHYLMRRAFFMATNPHFELGEAVPPARWARIFYADNWEDAKGFQPYTYIDISEVMEEWREAFRCFAIGRNEGAFPYWDWYEARTRLHGIAIGVAHAQAFAVEEAEKRVVQETL